MQKYCVLLLLLISTFSYGALEDKRGYFSGRISKVNKFASLIRVRIDFDNIRYLNKNDEVFFWSQVNEKNRCLATVEGKTNNYLLLKVPKYVDCIFKVRFTVGAYISFYSNDLVSNLKKGVEVLEVLNMKRLALEVKKKRLQRNLDNYVEKVSAVNSRYDTLREKLELEWRKELSDLENDKSVMLRNFKNVEILLHDIDYKIEKYRVTDRNLEMEKWSLDPKLYYRK